MKFKNAELASVQKMPCLTDDKKHHKKDNRGGFHEMVNS